MQSDLLLYSLEDRLQSGGGLICIPGQHGLHQLSGRYFLRLFRRNSFPGVLEMRDGLDLRP